ncbi:MAG TPA: LysR family transcriptional regulator [Polyangiaceae bacterium]|nr:LysR family transcriptional regulator [Polyangiaceae bacterium]
MMIEPLRHFVLVADHGTFTAAARLAHVSQPALTASIKRLEASMETRLFDRGRYGATLTATGAALLPHARAVVVALEEGARAVRDIETLEAGEVRIGGGSTACSYHLPPVLSKFAKRHPNVRIYLRELSESAALGAFENGELEMVVVRGKKGDLFRDDEFVLVAARGADASGLPFITLPDGSATRALVDRWFPDAVVAMELASISVVKGAVRAGLGVALLTRNAVATDLSLGRLVEVETKVTPIACPSRILHRGLDRLSPQAAALRTLMLEDAPRRPGRAAARRVL